MKDEAPQGFYYFEDFLTEDEEKLLLNNFLKLDWQPVNMYGVTAKRRVMHFGLDYAYESRKVKPTAQPPTFMENLIQRSASLIQISANEIAEILITEYKPGAGIGWHKDAPVFGDKIVVISLGAPCILKLRLPQNEAFIIYKKVIANRSAYVLSSEARNKWQHSIPSVKALRYSVTLRTLKK